MVPSGPPTPMGGAQQTLMRSSSSLLGGGAAGGSMQSQPPFSSLVSPRTQFGSNTLLGNISNVSSLLNHSFGNGGPGSGIGGMSGASVNLQHRGGGGDMGGGGANSSAAEQDSLSFGSSSGMAQGQHFQNSLGNQLGSEHSQSQQLDALQSFQQQQQLLRGGMGNAGGIGHVKMEQQMGPGELNGLSSQQLQALRGGGIGHVKMEPQQLQSMKGLGPVKMEPHSSEQMFMQQQQQQHQQQLLQLSRQNSQNASQLNLLQQQRIMQQQLHQHQQHQQQQQQLLKSLPQQRNQLQQQQQQLHPNSLPARAQVKQSAYEPGTCARRLTQYMYHQQHRPEDNNIEFWRKFVAEYFAPNAKKRWCVSLYGSGRQTTGVFPQDAWHCEICNRKPGRGFETTVEVLPRLCQIKYASGTLEELLYVDMPREYQNSSGQIVLDYAKAIQESVFEHLRVVRDGQLRIVFNSDLKISSWEFCARSHEELIPRRLLVPQVSQIGAVVQKYQASGQNGSSSLSAQDLQSTCNSFVTTARQLAKALEVPLVNDLGYTKRYVRCLQISEVVNSMKDLIDYSRETGAGPIGIPHPVPSIYSNFLHDGKNSLINFPRRASASSGSRIQQALQHEGHQSMSQNVNHNDQNSVHAAMQLPATGNGAVSRNNPLNAVTPAPTAATVVGLLHQNSMNSRQETQINSVNSPYGGGNTAQIPSASSSSSLPPPHPNPSSPFTSQTPAASNNPTSNSHGTNHLNSTNQPANMSGMQQTTPQSQEADPNDSQSSVHQILQEIMMSPQLSGVSSLGNEMKGINGVTPVLNGGSCLVGNGMVSNSTISGIGGVGFGSMGGLGSSATINGIRAVMSNNALGINGRVGINPLSQDPASMSHQQQDMGNRLLGGLGSLNSFNNLQFDWKSSP